MRRPRPGTNRLREIQGTDSQGPEKGPHHRRPPPASASPPASPPPSAAAPPPWGSPSSAPRKRAAPPRRAGTRPRPSSSAAHKAGLWAKSLNGDAFSEDIKAQAVALLKETGPRGPGRVQPWPPPAAPIRKTGEVYKSVLEAHRRSPTPTRPWTSIPAP